MEENTIKPGDVVCLKSGSPDLTVEQIFDGSHGLTARVVWFDGSEVRPMSAFICVECLDLKGDEDAKR